MNDKEKLLVEVNGGKLEGIYEDGLYVFKGIPYAAPPVGPLRWLPPQPPEKWDGVRPAKEFGAIAPQNAMPMADAVAPVFDEPQDEDCLFLNIWTPGLDDAKRPVMLDSRERWGAIAGKRSASIIGLLRADARKCILATALSRMW